MAEHLKTFVVAFCGRKHQWTHGGELADWKMTVEAVDETHAVEKIRQMWDVKGEVSVGVGVAP